MLIGWIGNQYYARQRLLHFPIAFFANQSDLNYLVYFQVLEPGGVSGKFGIAFEFLLFLGSVFLLVPFIIVSHGRVLSAHFDVINARHLEVLFANLQMKGLI